MSDMTSRERMRRALSGKPADRVPFFPCIYVDHVCLATGREYAEALVDPRIGVRAMLEANVLYGSDVVRVRSTPSHAWFQEKEVRFEGGYLVQIDRATGETDGRFDLDGGGALIPSHPPEAVGSIEEAETLTYPTADEMIGAGCMDAAREVAEEAHERGLFVVGMAGGQTINYLVANCGGPSRAMTMLVDEPGLAGRVMSVGTDASIELGNAFARIGVDCLYIGDAFASGSVISPAMYREFCAPLYARATESGHANGLLVYKHCCGNYTPLLPILREEPLDAMEGIDPTSGMSVAATAEALQGRMTMIGGVSCLTLCNGTPEAVLAEARACIREGGVDGRYVLGSACAVPRFTPPENMHAFARAAFETADGRR